MNDSPVDCQNREWTEPQRDRWIFAAGKKTDEVAKKEESRLKRRMQIVAISPQVTKGGRFAAGELSAVRLTEGD